MWIISSAYTDRREGEGKFSRAPRRLGGGGALSLKNTEKGVPDGY